MQLNITDKKINIVIVLNKCTYRELGIQHVKSPKPNYMADQFLVSDCKIQVFQFISCMDLKMRTGVPFWFKFKPKVISIKKPTYLDFGLKGGLLSGGQNFDLWSHQISMHFWPEEKYQLKRHFDRIF